MFIEYDLLSKFSDLAAPSIFKRDMKTREKRVGRRISVQNAPFKNPQ
jgi:hypothetical protein